MRLLPNMTILVTFAALAMCRAGLAQDAPQEPPAAPAPSQPAPPAGPDPVQVQMRIEEARAAMQRWVETRRIVSDEAQEWALGKELLESRIDILSRELASVQERIAEAEKSITEADERRAALVAENDRVRAGSAALAKVAAMMEMRTKQLVARLPDPIRERIRPLSSRLPEDPSTTTLPLTTRFQNVVGIVNEVNKFNREITTTTEIRKLADGSSAEVTVVYLGLAQAFFVGGSGRVAGYGGASADGWTSVAASLAAMSSNLRRQASRPSGTLPTVNAIRRFRSSSFRR
ncbi:MAG: DUF3450 domain-containing protein [Phycisphaerales bacterium]|nr:DUF3450 domain-containing protein [Phycisphaerales bacterium]